MIEVERRFRLSQGDLSRLENSLDWSSPEQVRDLTFGPSGARSMQVDGWVIRLRSKGEGTRMEYKAPATPDWTSWTEIGVDIDDFGNGARLLQRIGLKPGLLIDRSRRIAHDGDLVFSLDGFDLLGDFLECETSSAATEEEGLGAIAQACAELGLLDPDGSRPYGELLLDLMAEDPEVRRRHDEEIAALLGE
jgi:predicted adenylyl cyclase CyaB